MSVVHVSFLQQICICKKLNFRSNQVFQITKIMSGKYVRVQTVCLSVSLLTPGVKKNSQDLKRSSILYLLPKSISELFCRFDSIQHVFIVKVNRANKIPDSDSAFSFLHYQHYPIFPYR
jgi:hypothetical protein